ncbi:unnamed protein product [Toxocara canis]|uniref:Coiled-coil domain-containing protein 85A n=1 Tax=Toxocara canis TaxID=6265 RepID=A0A183TW64_TOXCA|nr:unnamed protein product [Toxocara canis]
MEQRRFQMATSRLDRQQSHPLLSYGCASSVAALEGLKRRVQMMEVENRRLMSSQGQLVADTNKRVEMHMSEIKALKDELKSAQRSNKELRDLCCFLDDDRQKIRQLSNEWQKFGRYTSEVMKQEVRAYQKKLQELEQRQRMLVDENDELKRLCLYLDEQRQTLICEREALYANITKDRGNVAITAANGSVKCDSSGCGSSAGSPRGSEDESDLTTKSAAPQASVTTYDQKQERALQMITQQMQTSMCEARISDTEHSSGTGISRHEHILDYMRSLENRIRQLELCNQSSAESFWRSNGNILSEFEDRTVVERNELNCASSNSMQSIDLDEVTFEGSASCSKLLTRPAVDKDGMFESTSTITSSGTTFCSSETDESAERAVFVMGDERDTVASALEVRTLGPIDEEREDDLSMSARWVDRPDDASRPMNGPQILADERSLCSSDMRDPVKKLMEPEIADESFVEMPPAIAPLSDSVSRLSLCTPDTPLEGLVASRPSAEVRISSPIHGDGSAIPITIEHDSSYDHALSGFDRGNSTVRDSLAEAVEVLRVHELTARKNMRGLSAHETAIVQHMCQVGLSQLPQCYVPMCIILFVAWNSLDRKSHLLNNTDNQQRSIKSNMTAV